ncbi:MAG: prepilin-type N-terminal cleavage/methylation domain-containing protein [Nitrospirae bacterium]|nr:prepilin-type N-terminal cleavage/methylation domain-containing protein [Nitrospirota bacterium]
MRRNHKGFTMIESLMALAITIIIVGSITAAYMAVVRDFKDVKSIADNLQTKTPAIELMGRFFDRWGVGVVSQQDDSNCTNCPSTQRAMTITTTNGCSDATFYGNIYGMGFVYSVSGSTANIISCRLKSNATDNCYVIWRDNVTANSISGGSVVPESIANLSSDDKTCSDLTAGATSNVTANSAMTSQTVQSGDVLQRFWHTIRFYCSTNSNDSNKNWLYVDLTDASICGNSQSAVPVAPVEAFSATAMPSGTNCSSSAGGTACRAVNVSLTFRSQSAKYTGGSGSYDNYTTSNKVFGR